MKWLVPLVFITSCSSAPIEQPDPKPPAEPPNKANAEKLVACGAIDCGASAQRIEGGVPFAMYNMACVVQALRDRTPGSYNVKLDHTWSNGSENADMYLRVLASGDVMVATHRSLQIDGQPLEETWDLVRRCSLVTPNFFDTCLTAVQMGQGPDATPEAWDCVFPESAVSTFALPWFTMCLEAVPVCE